MERREERTTREKMFILNAPLLYMPAGSDPWSRILLIRRILKLIMYEGTRRNECRL